MKPQRDEDMEKKYIYMKNRKPSFLFILKLYEHNSLPTTGHGKSRSKRLNLKRPN